ncbi:MFS transporter [Staphylococcus simulans]|uniref:MFS transporter n=1 Tax=Staphylococcus simulans TaxID=1286 RepID=UPI0027FDFF20|nr:MFS transporter [Staphylococcus simulans]MDQ7111698.1 MFS transporter [Staphylococcus simulans]MDQ7118858.1 MFS transporter [Staphylococcus simulans]WMM11060.1 MFS transporter [Staphylococcus simulans]
MRFSKLVIPGILMIAVTYGLGRFSFGLFLPDISQDLSLTPTQAGLISSLFYLSYCFSIIFATFKTDKVGPKNMIMAAGLSVLIGLILIGISPNLMILALGVLFAGASTGFVSPPYGYVISLWIKLEEQSKANTWINSGTSIGLMLAGVTAMIAFLDWRTMYLSYAVLALIMLVWNFIIIPSLNQPLEIYTGSFNLLDVKNGSRIALASTLLGIATAPFWTFSKSFVQATDLYTNFQLSIFWILIGVFGIIGGVSGNIIEQKGIRFAYNLGVIAISAASILLALAQLLWITPFIASSLFGVSYIFLTGVLMVWGIRVYVRNASIGIGIPFLLLAVGQVIGSILAGPLIVFLNYKATFVVFGLISLSALWIYPKFKLKDNPVPEAEYSKLQEDNKHVLKDFEEE